MKEPLQLAEADGAHDAPGTMVLVLVGNEIGLGVIAMRYEVMPSSA